MTDTGSIQTLLEQALAAFLARDQELGEQIAVLTAERATVGRELIAARAALEAYRSSIAATTTPIDVALPPQPAATPSPLPEPTDGPVDLLECRSCGLVKEPTDFYLSDGRRRLDCKECCKARWPSTGGASSPRSNLKRCARCHEAKPLDAFYTTRGDPRSYCKPCDNARRQETELARRERRAAAEAILEAEAEPSSERASDSEPSNEVVKSEPAECPPHIWMVDTRWAQGLRIEHHECQRCGAQKDVEHRIGESAKRWSGAGKSALFAGAKSG